MKAEIKGNQLVITVDLQTPTPSASGKTLVVASSHGNTPTTATVNGQPVIVGLNAYIKRQIDHAARGSNYGCSSVCIVNPNKEGGEDMIFTDISTINWYIFQRQFPEAYSFLLRASLQGEAARLAMTHPRNEWEENRLQELYNYSTSQYNNIKEVSSDDAGTISGRH